MFLGYRPTDGSFWLVPTIEEVLEEFSLGENIQTHEYCQLVVDDDDDTIAARPLTLRPVRTEDESVDIYELESDGQVVATLRRARQG